VVGAAFAEAAFRRGAFASPTAANLDPEAVVFAAWCAADLAADLAAFLAAITLLYRASLSETAETGSQAGRNSVRVNSPCPGARSGVDVVLDLMPPPGLGALTGGPSPGAAVEVVDRSVEVDRPVPLVGQVLVSPHGRAWPQTLADLVAEPGPARPGRCAGAYADRVGPAARVATTPRRQRLKRYARPDTVPHGHVVPPLVLVQSAKSPQEVRKTSINVHHQRTPFDTIRAGQSPCGGQMRRSESRPNRVYTAGVVGSSPAGPT
jgi:hypothetical protein